MISENATVATHGILASLLSLATSSRSLPCDCLRSIQSHLVKKHDVDGPTLAFPLLGHFRYNDNQTWREVHPGNILVVPNARCFDIEYIPDPDKNEFIALSVVLLDEQLEAARLLLAQPPENELGHISSVEVATLLDPLERWTRAMADGHRALSLHAMVEVVIHLHGQGQRGLLRLPAASLATTIRRMVVNDPARSWSTEQIESSIGISGPTLRRRLADEHTNLRTIIADARVSEALRLLMTSKLPVKTIASKVGYNSAASFSKRFTERYGTEPSRFR
ncbi:helix-turn-helix transcriptional regulator [Pseudomonas batumici]|uniref:helix-turn-helix transcriptional regulator n=1 Tax=Pseudomonas batumici TaxID=226910 RepID=UPI0030CE8B56